MKEKRNFPTVLKLDTEQNHVSVAQWKSRPLIRSRSRSKIRCIIQKRKAGGNHTPYLDAIAVTPSFIVIIVQQSATVIEEDDL
jgi:hypothetical protein